MRFAALSLCTALLTLSPVQAAPVFDTFGALPEATFDGDGIPNDAVAISTVDLGGGVTATVGLTATERYFNPDVGNDGAGTFFATTGLNNGFGTSTVLGATWNFGFYVGLSSGTFADLDPDIKMILAYDTDPSTEFMPGGIDLLAGAAGLGVLGSSVLEGSQNLAFDFLNVGPTAPWIGLPPFMFNPFAQGEYSIALITRDDGALLNRTSIEVIVEIVPSPAALGMMLSGILMIGLGTAFRRRT